MISLDVVVKRSPSSVIVYCEDAEQSSIFLNYIGSVLDFCWEYSDEPVSDDFNMGGDDYSGAYYLLYKRSISDKYVMTYLYYDDVKDDMEKYHYDTYCFNDFYEFDKSLNDVEIEASNELEKFLNLYGGSV